MSKFKLSKRSRRNLEGVHPDLVAVVNRAIEITSVDFGVIEGLRTTERQKEMVRTGASKTMNSRHLTGHAVDLAAYLGSRISWEWPLYDRIYEAMSKAARELGIDIEWGGNWKTLKDGPHYQLSWARYPSRKDF